MKRRKYLTSAWLAVASLLPGSGRLVQFGSQAGAADGKTIAAAGTGGAGVAWVGSKIFAVGEDAAKLFKPTIAVGHEVEDAIALRKLHPEEWKLFAPLAENTETAKNIPKAELASVWRSDPEVREGIFQDLRTTHPHFVNAEVEGILADTPRHPTFSAPVLQGSSELAVSDAVWHEPVTLVDSLGNPLRTADTTTARLAEAAYREKAALILDEALSGVPVDQWKSQEKLRAAIATALRKEPARTYSLDVASGKLTLKTKVKGLELSGEMNIYQAATKAVKAGGLAGAGYAAGPVRDLANRFLSKGTDQNKKP